jgi:hypothetical protein
MPKTIENSVASGFVRPLNVPNCTIDESLIREVAGTRYMIEPRPVAIFRSVLNSVIHAAEKEVELQESIGNPLITSQKTVDISLATAKAANAHNLLEDGSLLICEGSACMPTSTFTDRNTFRSVGIGEHHRVVGLYKAAIYSSYESVTQEEMRRHFAGVKGIKGAMRLGGMVVLKNAQLYANNSREPKAEYATAVLPFNEPALRIYRARKI